LLTPAISFGVSRNHQYQTVTHTPPSTANTPKVPRQPTISAKLSTMIGESAPPTRLPIHTMPVARARSFTGNQREMAAELVG